VAKEPLLAMGECPHLSPILAMKSLDPSSPFFFSIYFFFSSASSYYSYSLILLLLQLGKSCPELETVEIASTLSVNPLMFQSPDIVAQFRLPEVCTLPPIVIFFQMVIKSYIHV
jgi:hypothetical protein